MFPKTILIYRVLPFLALVMIVLFLIIVYNENESMSIINRNDNKAGYQSEYGKDNNDMEQEKTFLNDSKPPLDLQVPLKLETATLGLG